MAEYLATDTDLEAVAAAIRTKGGTSAPLEFPDGFVGAIEDIPTGTDTSDATATAGDILSGKTAYIATGKATGTIASKSSSDLTASGDTVSVPAGYYAGTASKAVAAGTEGTPTTLKGSVSNHSVQVTSSVTNTAGYISGGTHTDSSGVSVAASELVSGTKTITQNGSHDVTNYASAEVSVPTGTARTSADLTASGDTVTAPAGLYAEAASKAVAAGSVAAPTATKGKVTNNAMNITPHVRVTAGYVSGGDIAGSQVQVAASELVSGTKNITGSGTTDVTNYAAVSVPAGTEGTPTNQVSPVTNHSVIISPRVTNSAGYIVGTQKVGNNTMVYASDLVSGTKNITQNGSYDVTNNANADVVVGVDSSTPTAFSGLLKGNGSTVAQAVAGTDYQAPISAANKLPVANVSGYTTTQMVVTYDDDSTATFNVMVVSAS